MLSVLSFQKSFLTLTLDTKTLRDFNVIYTDFVGEKKGNITDYYNILDPPIGTGILNNT